MLQAGTVLTHFMLLDRAGLGGYALIRNNTVIQGCGAYNSSLRLRFAEVNSGGGIAVSAFFKIIDDR